MRRRRCFFEDPNFPELVRSELSHAAHPAFCRLCFTGRFYRLKHVSEAPFRSQLKTGFSPPAGGHFPFWEVGYRYDPLTRHPLFGKLSYPKGIAFGLSDVESKESFPCAGIASIATLYRCFRSRSSRKPNKVQKRNVRCKFKRRENRCAFER